MKKRVIAVLILFLSANFVFSQDSLPPLSSRIANYTMTVSLDPAKKLVKGTEVLLWKNTSQNFIPDIYFHLYMNAFRNEKSTFMQESGGQLHGHKFTKERSGSIKINRIKLKDGSVLTDSLHFVSPDDGNPNDRTVAKLNLPEGIPPGGQIKLFIEFETKLPKVFARAGYYRNFFMVAQWFPKVGVYENGKWNCHQYHATSEFFADFGVYDVTIFVPKDFKVGAVGQLVESNVTDSLRMYKFLAEDVHDFAWAADPDFEVAETTFTKVIPGRKPEKVRIKLFYQPFHKRFVNRYFKAVKSAMEYFYIYVGTYPYPVLTMIDPPTSAAGAGGMEYPTLITLGTHWLTPGGIRLPETVAIHEFGHQYWYGMVANNEFEEAWLDEGITTYYEAKILGHYYGQGTSAVNLLGVKISDTELQWSEYLRDADRDPIERFAWKFYNSASYSSNSYSKPVMMLYTLQGYLGFSMMDCVMHIYFERWKFKHPTGKDFVAVVNEVTGENWNWYFDQFLYHSGTLDYAVGSIRNHKMTAKTDSLMKMNRSGEMDSLSGKAEPDSVFYKSTVKVVRNGSFHLPIEVQLDFEKDSSAVVTWDGISPWHKWTIKSRRKIISVQIDPQHKIWLDENIVNNSMTTKTQKRAVNRMSLRLFFWIQNLLQLFAFWS